MQTLKREQARTSEVAEAESQLANDGGESFGLVLPEAEDEPAEGRVDPVRARAGRRQNPHVRELPLSCWVRCRGTHPPDHMIRNVSHDRRPPDVVIDGDASIRGTTDRPRAETLPLGQPRLGQGGMNTRCWTVQTEFSEDVRSVSTVKGMFGSF